MLTAFEEGTRTLIFASKGIVAVCPECGEKLITKCGKIVTPYFSHIAKNNCGSAYHDGVSEWHYNWQLKIKDPIPGVNIEVPIQGEYLKRADVVTKEGVVVEFQKSPLPIDERILRENHYKNMIWVVHKDISNSKTWKYNKSNVVVLIDDPERKHLYMNTDEKTRFDKIGFVNTVMNGTVAYPDVFFKHVMTTRLARKNIRRYNALLDYRIIYGQECARYYAFKFLTDCIIMEPGSRFFGF